MVNSAACDLSAWLNTLGVYNQLKDGGEMGPGVNSDVSDYNSELLSEALPQLSHDWPYLSLFFIYFLVGSTSFGIPSHVDYLLS